MKLLEFFERNITKYSAEEERLSGLFNRISAIRIAAVILGLIGIVYFANAGNGVAVTAVLVLLVLSFGVLVKWHNRVKYARNHAGFLKTINEQEIARINGDLDGMDGGKEFTSATHYYTGDLDVFGDNSLFGILNRCTTVTGRSVLASWLSSPANRDDIIERQQAVEELSKQPEFCQNFEAVGLHHVSDKATADPLINWLKSPSMISNRWIKWVSIASVMLVITLGGSAFFGLIPYGYAVIFLLINAGLLKYILKYSLEVTEQTSQGVKTLSGIADLIRQIEGASFNSPLLVRLKSSFENSGISVSVKIRRLASTLDFLNARSNMFYAVFNITFLIDVFLLSMAEKWKEENREEVKFWFDNISQLEALMSFGRFAFANPEYVMPQISDGKSELKASSVGHPLISAQERISNDFAINDRQNTAIITGSNMSGKSTFLRTIGINMILAYAGAPVCAVNFKLSRFQVFTSMRTQDNLREHISSFYAELKRIEQLLGLLEQSELPVFFMLDEILKGTNSEDRHRGALALVKQLSPMNAVGFVSTHDLNLGNEADEYDYCENYSFNSQVVEDQISFDYKIEKGICHSFNASALMKNIGIEIEE